MKSSRSSFTMVELIFVIVIIGILSAVAIPKLYATRDDAIISKVAQNIGAGIEEVESYTVAKGTVDKNLSEISNAIKLLKKEGYATVEDSASDKNATIKAGSVSDCITLHIRKSSSESNLSIVYSSDTTDRLCQSLKSLVAEGNYAVKLAGGTIVY